MAKGTPYDAMFDDLRRGIDPEVAADIGHPVPEHLLEAKTVVRPGETALAGAGVEVSTDDPNHPRYKYWPTPEQSEVGRAARQAIREKYGL